MWLHTSRSSTFIPAKLSNFKMVSAVSKEFFFILSLISLTSNSATSYKLFMFQSYFFWDMIYKLLPTRPVACRPVAYLMLMPGSKGNSRTLSHCLPFSIFLYDFLVPCISIWYLLLELYIYLLFNRIPVSSAQCLYFFLLSDSWRDSGFDSFPSSVDFIFYLTSITSP